MSDREIEYLDLDDVVLLATAASCAATVANRVRAGLAEPGPT